jgi:flagellar biogenesis protein FliO
MAGGGGSGLGSMWQLVQIIVAVAGVAGLALLTTRLLGKRFGRAHGGRRVQVVEMVGLSPKASLCLARVDGRTVLLGVTEHQVSRLLMLEGAAGAPAPQAGARPAAHDEAAGGTGGGGGAGGAGGPGEAAGAGGAMEARGTSLGDAGFIDRLLEGLTCRTRGRAARRGTGAGRF